MSSSRGPNAYNELVANKEFLEFLTQDQIDNMSVGELQEAIQAHKEAESKKKR